MTAARRRPDGERELVIKLKRETGLTQLEISQRTGIPRGTIGRMIAEDRAAALTRKTPER